MVQYYRVKDDDVGSIGIRTTFFSEVSSQCGRSVLHSFCEGGSPGCDYTFFVDNNNDVGDDGSIGLMGTLRF